MYQTRLKSLRDGFSHGLSFVGWLILGLVILRPNAWAETETHLLGHVKYQATGVSQRSGSLSAFLGADKYLTNEVDLRLGANRYFGDFHFDLQAELLGSGGGGVSPMDGGASDAYLLNRLLGRATLPNDDRRLLDLTLNDESSDFSTALRLDRISLSYFTDNIVIKLGRQAITWGNGLSLSVLDVYNPFEPLAIDKDYKTGDDLAYVQLPFSNGDDLQLLYVQRRNPDTRSIEAIESSFASKYHGALPENELDYDVLLARHHDEQHFAVGFSKSLVGAVLRSDFRYAILPDESDEFSFLVNVDRTWVVFEKNLYTFLEYYRNGLGVSDGNYLSLDENLVDRISRGEVFTLGRDFLSLGARLELTALLQVYSNMLINLHDESGVGQLRFEYDLAENLLVTFGFNVAYGAEGSEYGGIPVQFAGEEKTLAAPNEVYLRVAYYY
ncbi:hypothetical protein BVY02_02015 [bacterium J17]|nr:hypothetical protein BVY02_02015 [bacterium J17]